MPATLTSYAIVGGVAAAVTVMTVPVFRVIAETKGMTAAPNERDAHDRPTANIGGGAMLVGFVVAYGVAWLSGMFDSVFTDSTDPIGILVCALLVYVVGLRDDVRAISAPAKIAGLVLAASILAVSGVSIIWFRIPFVDPIVLDPSLSFLISVIWILVMANAVNFIDGLDGLAAGIVGIGALSFFLYSLRLTSVEILESNNVGPLVAAIVAGICLGFLPWNTHPAKIFMGDGGSLLLGSMMAASTMAVGGRIPDPYSGQTFFFYAPLVIPLVILGVPIIDTAFAIIRRASRGQALSTADKDHLHHRLMRLGHGHRTSVFILWAWTALLSGFVLWPVYNDGQLDAIVPGGVVALALVLYMLFKPGLARDRRSGPGGARKDSDTEGGDESEPNAHPRPRLVPDPDSKRQAS